MDDRQHEEMIRLQDVGQPKVVRVSFTVTVEMTGQQCDAYSHDHGVGFVSLEVKARFPGDAREALSGIPWVREYARVTVSDPKIEKG
jgi:hypothetical protein